MNLESQTLEPVSNFPEQIGYHLSGLEEVRDQLRKAVADLSNEEISLRFAPETHSIGQLILHNAEAEWWWIQCVLAGKKPDETEAISQAHWDVFLEEDFKSKNYSAEFCISEIDRV